MQIDKAVSQSRQNSNGFKNQSFEKQTLDYSLGRTLHIKQAV
jgi:hypothetical protein